MLCRRLIRILCVVSHFFPGAILFLNSSSDVIGIVKEVSALSEITSSKLNRQVTTYDTLKLLLLLY
jgi:hypothetical protein